MNDMAYCAIPSAWLVEAGNTTAAAADDDDDEEYRNLRARQAFCRLLRRAFFRTELCFFGVLGFLFLSEFRGCCYGRGRLP